MDTGRIPPLSPPASSSRPEFLNSGKARAATLAAMVMTVGNWSCPPGDSDYGDPVETDPIVASVEIVPDRAYVTEGSIFVVSVRLRDADGRIIEAEPNANLTWDFSPDDGTFREHPPTRELPDPGKQATYLKVRDDLELDSILIHVYANIYEIRGVGQLKALKRPPLAPADFRDRILADHDDGSPLEAALVTGWSGECIHDKVWTFSGLLPLFPFFSSFQCTKSDQVAVFSADRAIAYSPETTSLFRWTTGTDIVDASATPQPTSVKIPPKPNRQLPVRIWMVSNGDPVEEAIITDNPAEVSALYRSNRTGIAVGTIGSPTAIADIYLLGNPCSEAKKQLAHANLKFDDPTVVHVFYMSASQSEGYGRGWHCRTPADSADLIFVYTKFYLPNTLAHEAGHALGLRGSMALGGHTNDYEGYITGFHPTNLMWGWVDDEMIAADRDHISLGQVFRMSFDKESWLNLPNSGTQSAYSLDCGNTDSDNPCPRLCRDVSPPLDPTDPGIECKLVSNN